MNRDKKEKKISGSSTDASANLDPVSSDDRRDQNTDSGMSRRTFIGGAATLAVATSVGALALHSSELEAAVPQLQQKAATALPAIGTGILSKIEAILKNLVAQGRATVETGLKNLAASAPTNAGPLLALAMVQIYEQPERFAEAKATLARAIPLVPQTPANAEAAFFSALAAAVSAQLSLFSYSKTSGLAHVANTTIEQRKQTSLQDLSTAAAKQGSEFAKVIASAMLVFCRSSAPTVSDRNYATGMTGLTSISAESTNRSLASFFAMNGHCAVGDYNNAISIGRQLEVQNPNSPLVKNYIGSCYFKLNDKVNAEKHFKQALALSPNDVSVNLSLAILYHSTGNATLATQYKSNVTRLDTTGSFAIYTSSLKIIK